MDRADKFVTLDRFAAAGRNPRVLVAVSERARARLAVVLRNCGATFVATRSELARALEAERYDLVVLGAHFDRSHAIESLEDVMRERPGCPVVCVLATRFGPSLERRAFYAFRTACLELGARDVLDLTRWPDDQDGNGRVRILLERMISPQAC